MDIREPELGQFGTSYDISATGFARIREERNIVATMVCTSNNGEVPPPPTNLGCSRVADGVEFRFEPPPKRDGEQVGSAVQTELLWRDGRGRWKSWGIIGSGRRSLLVEQLPAAGVLLWGARSIDRGGRPGLLSNITLTAPFRVAEFYGYDSGEPNGRIKDAAPLVPPIDLRQNLFSAGDEDYYAVDAAPGDTIVASASTLGGGVNPVVPVLALLDRRGSVLVQGEGIPGSTGPSIRYVVREGRGESPNRSCYLYVADLYGSIVSPSTTPRIHVDTGYRVQLEVLPADQTQVRRSVQGGPGIVNVTADGRGAQVRLAVSGQARHVSARVYGVNGRLIRVLYDQEAVGELSMEWSGRNASNVRMPTGVYYLRIDIGNMKVVRTIALIH